MERRPGDRHAGGQARKTWASYARGATVDRFAEDTMMPSRKPVALVTGANKGVGFEVARAIAKSGYVVLLGARNPTTGREAADTLTREKLDVRFVELDVTRMETIS